MRIDFYDHMGRRQFFAGEKSERDSHAVAGRLVDLVNCRRNGAPPTGPLSRWLDAMPVRQRKQLEAMDLIDRTAEEIDRPLVEHLNGRKDAAGVLVSPGYRQALESRAVTEKHVELTCKRIQAVIDGAGFANWRELAAAGAAGRVQHWLKSQRDAGEMSAVTANYYIREMKGFCRWLHEQGFVPSVALQALKGFKNAKAESVERPDLSIDEVRWLVATTEKSTLERQRMSGAERALLYRFTFETGLRPGATRSLLVKSFQLDGEFPSVTTLAKYNKRRTTHQQPLRAGLAGILAERFKTMMPTATAIKMPRSRDHLADMLREDAAEARKAWIAAAGKDEKEQERRHRSDFLAEIDHDGRRLVFYSLRHGHGTALADAGVPEKDIAASMHHTSRKTTERYLHSNQQAVRLAIDAMPDLALPEAQAAVATGTNGAGTEGGETARIGAPRTSLVQNQRQLMAVGGNGQERADSAMIGVTPENTGETAGLSDSDPDGPHDGIGRRSGFKIHSAHHENPGKTSISGDFASPSHKPRTNPAPDQLQDLLPLLSTQQRRQVLALVRSMIQR